MNQLNEFERNYTDSYKKKRNLKIAGVIGICIIIALLFAFCHKTEEIPAGVALNYGEEQVEEDYAEGIVCPGWGTMYTEANTKDITVNLFNPEENAGVVDGMGYNMIFTMIVDGVEIYTSPEVEPGDSITTAHISTVIPTGQHNCVIHIQPVRQSDGVYTNNANMTCNLIAVEG